MLNGGRIWMIIGAFVGAIVVGFGYLVAAAPLLSQADTADAQRAEVEAVNAGHEQTLASMMALDARKDELLDRIAELGVSVPVVLDAEDFLDEVSLAATMSPVSLSGVRLGAPVLFTPPAEAGPVVFQPALQQRLHLVQVTIDIGGDAAQVSAFVKQLQTQGRLQLITRFDSRLGSSLTGTVTGYIFVVLDPEVGALVPVLAPPAPPVEDSTDGEASTDESGDPQPGATPTPPADASGSNG